MWPLLLNLRAPLWLGPPHRGAPRTAGEHPDKLATVASGTSDQDGMTSRHTGLGAPAGSWHLRCARPRGPWPVHWPRAGPVNAAAGHGHAQGRARGSPTFDVDAAAKHLADVKAHRDKPCSASPRHCMQDEVHKLGTAVTESVDLRAERDLTLPQCVPILPFVSQLSPSWCWRAMVVCIAILLLMPPRCCTA